MLFFSAFHHNHKKTDFPNSLPDPGRINSLPWSKYSFEGLFEEGRTSATHEKALSQVNNFFYNVQNLNECMEGR